MNAENAQSAERSQEFFLENEKQLRLKYPDEYVAIAEEEVVEHAPDHSELLEKIENSQYQVSEVLVRFVRKGRNVIR